MTRNNAIRLENRRLRKLLTALRALPIFIPCPTCSGMDNRIDFEPLDVLLKLVEEADDGTEKRVKIAECRNGHSVGVWLNEV